MGRMSDVKSAWGRVRNSFPHLGRLRSQNRPPNIPTEILLLSGFNDGLRRAKQLERINSEKSRRELQSILRCVLTEQASAHLETIKDPKHQAEIVRICHRISLLRALYPNMKTKVGDELDLNTHEAAIEHFHMLLVVIEKLANQVSVHRSGDVYSVRTRLTYLQTNLGILADLDRRSVSQFHWQMAGLIMLRMHSLEARLSA